VPKMMVRIDAQRGRGAGGREGRRCLRPNVHSARGLGRFQDDIRVKRRICSANETDRRGYAAL
jgi:hypothetical protein